MYNFFTSLEVYGRKVVGRSPLPYTWIVLGLTVIVLLVSVFSNGMTRATSVEQAMRLAVAQGDYALAEQLYVTTDSEVLGANSEIEALIYPERIVERRIAALEQKLEIYPGNKEIYLLLAQLYDQIGNQEMAREYSEQARILDPNGN